MAFPRQRAGSMRPWYWLSRELNPNMHLYKHRLNSEIIEFVGLSNHDLQFRYLGEEFKEVFFSLSKETLKRYYVKVKNDR